MDIKSLVHVFLIRKSYKFVFVFNDAFFMFRHYGVIGAKRSLSYEPVPSNQMLCKSKLVRHQFGEAQLGQDVVATLRKKTTKD